MFTNAVVRRRRLPAASWSSIWYLLSSFAVISYTNHWGYVIFAATGSFIGAYAVMSYLHPGPTYPPPPGRLGPRLGGREMSDWTLGGVKARNMEINALCEQEGCRHLFVFNLDRLIEGVGPGYLIADIPPMACPQCGSPLAIRLSFADPPAGGGGLAHRRRSVGLGKAKRAHRDSFRVGNGQAVAHLT